MADTDETVEETEEETTEEEATAETEETEETTETTEEIDSDDSAETTLEEELITELTAELEISDENFNATLLALKVKGAIRDVKRTRKYPSYYTDDQIDSDLYDHYEICKRIALNDYNKIGIDTESSHNENSISATYTDRDKLFSGVIPFAK